MVFGEDKGKGVVLCAALSQQAEGYVYQVRQVQMRHRTTGGRRCKVGRGFPKLKHHPPGTNPPYLQLSVSNVAVGAPLNGFMIQLNKNALGLAPASQHVALDAGWLRVCAWCWWCGWGAREAAANERSTTVTIGCGQQHRMPARLITWPSFPPTPSVPQCHPAPPPPRACRWCTTQR